MTSGRAIDHVVLAVQDLDRTALKYQELGFTLTPRAAHEDRMGTSNRLAQFRGRNFIELLEVDRPDRLERHDFAASPPFFSFGDHNRLAVRERDGLSMMVFASDNARADLLSFSSADLPTFAPFDFERRAELPDGRQVTVPFRWRSYNLRRCRKLRSSFARTKRRTISGSLNTNRMRTAL